MPMTGFDPKWKDFPDYILGITREIWEGRGIATLHHYYTKDIVMRMPSGLSRGNAGVIAGTMATIAQFPDRQLLGEDVIFSDHPKHGFLSSHRLRTTCTHTGDGMFGPPTGRKLRFSVIADCAAKADQIYDEWLVRDNGAIVRQLGHEPKQFAADQIAREGGPDKAQRPFTPAADVDGGYQGKGNDHPAGQRYADILTRLMGADFAAIEKEYDRACHLTYAGGVTGHGRGLADGFWLGLRAAFPSAQFEIHHVIGRDDMGLPPRAALRWSLTGKHDGWGAFGAPTGADVHVMGLSHAEFGPWGLRREYALYDETAIWKQILLHTG